MKLFVFALCLALGVAAPQDHQDVQVLRYDSDVGIAGYNFAYELSDGTKRDEQGELRNAGTDSETYAVHGSYTWVAPDGVIWVVTFVADENGFQPKVTQGGGGITGGVVASLLG